MPVSFMAVCDELREYIDPNDVEGGGDKRWHFTREPFARVLVERVAGAWFGKKIHVVNDTGDEWDDVKRSYRNATAEAVREANEEFEIRVVDRARKEQER